MKKTMKAENGKLKWREGDFRFPRFRFHPCMVICERRADSLKSGWRF
jgi:hypothetical protein